MRVVCIVQRMIKQRPATHLRHVSQRIGVARSVAIIAAQIVISRFQLATAEQICSDLTLREGTRRRLRNPHGDRVVKGRARQCLR
jgi:hypothetical protein